MRRRSPCIRRPARTPAGRVELGFGVPDRQAFYGAMTAKGVMFPLAPKQQDYGGMQAQFVDSEGAAVSVNGK